MDKEELDKYVFAAQTTDGLMVRLTGQPLMGSRFTNADIK